MLNDSFVNRIEDDQSPSSNRRRLNHIDKSVYDWSIPAFIEPQNFLDEHQEVLKSHVDAHNQLRENPKSFIPYWEERLKYMNGDYYCYNPHNKAKSDILVNIKTAEGVTAINEAIKFLK